MVLPAVRARMDCNRDYGQRTQVEARMDRYRNRATGAPFNEEADMGKQWSHAGVRKFIATTAAAVSIWAALPAKVVEAKPSTLVVPTNYPTIQSAVDAAAPGDTVQVLAGSYTEQVSIGKDLTIAGAGMDKTIVRAPSSLSLNALAETSIVEIHDGASVSMTRLTVKGPGSDRK